MLTVPATKMRYTIFLHTYFLIFSTKLVQSNPVISKFEDFALDNVTPTCANQLSEYITKLGNLTEFSWAVQMLDATSKIPTGLMYLNFGEIGNFEECISIKTNDTSTSETIYGKYCLGYVSVNLGEVSLRSNMFGSLGEVSQSTRTQSPTWSICVPHGCTTSDVNSIANFLLAELEIESEIGIGFSDNFCQTIDDVEHDLETGAVVTIAFLALLIFSVIIATAYDIYLEQIKQIDTSPFVRGFSLYSNGQKVFKMTKYKSDQISCLDGLRVLSMVWVVAGHQYSVTLTGPIINAKYLLQWVDSLHSMFLISGTLSVDTFLVITGSLITYTFMRSRQKNTKFNLFLYYLHRYLRLTPPLAVVVLISATLIKYMGSGPKWPAANMFFQNNCEEYWWSALLYVQNYVNVTKMCVGQTWYLSIDMQLYLISPVVLFILWKRSKIALPLLGLTIVAILGAAFYVAWIYNLPAILSNLYGDAYNYNNQYYLLTHTRAAPWFIGVILGFYLFQIKQNNIKFRLKKIVAIVVWLIALSVLLACALGGHSTLRGPKYDKWGNVLHITFVRPIWSVAIAVIILLCSANYGGPINWILSLPIYQVLNRFTYSIYLTHVSMLYLRGFAIKAPKYFSELDMAFDFWGTLWISGALSAALVFMVESPMIVVEKLLLGNIGKRNLPSRKDEENGVVNNGFQK